MRDRAAARARASPFRGHPCRCPSTLRSARPSSAGRPCGRAAVTVPIRLGTRVRIQVARSGFASLGIGVGRGGGVPPWTETPSAASAVDHGLRDAPEPCHCRRDDRSRCGVALRLPSGDDAECPADRHAAARLRRGVAAATARLAGCERWGSCRGRSAARCRRLDAAARWPTAAPRRAAMQREHDRCRQRARRGSVPRRGNVGSRIAMSRPSSCERCAIARLAPARTAGKRPERITRAISSSWSA